MKDGWTIVKKIDEQIDARIAFLRTQQDVITDPIQECINRQGVLELERLKILITAEIAALTEAKLREADK